MCAINLTDVDNSRKRQGITIFDATLKVHDPSTYDPAADAGSHQIIFGSSPLPASPLPQSSVRISVSPRASRDVSRCGTPQADDNCRGSTNASINVLSPGNLLAVGRPSASTNVNAVRRGSLVRRNSLNSLSKASLSLSAADDDKSGISILGERSSTGQMPEISVENADVSTHKNGLTVPTMPQVRRNSVGVATAAANTHLGVKNLASIIPRSSGVLRAGKLTDATNAATAKSTNTNLQVGMGDLFVRNSCTLSTSVAGKRNASPVTSVSLSPEPEMTEKSRRLSLLVPQEDCAPSTELNAESGQICSYAYEKVDFQKMDGWHQISVQSEQQNTDGGGEMMLRRLSHCQLKKTLTNKIFW